MRYEITIQRTIRYLAVVHTDSLEDAKITALGRLNALTPGEAAEELNGETVDDAEVVSTLPTSATEQTIRKLIDLDKDHPGWRGFQHPNGKPKFALDGTLLDENGNRSIFDDIDE